ncbi:MAG: PDC sensor domain-containing protein [Gammaproteobacteria bacterium]|nr:PDC sensor domain-containing protein [Gammaproteobacteria bacterium]
MSQVARQRKVLQTFLAESMLKLAEQCASQMDQPEKLDELLLAHFKKNSYGKYLWVVDHTGRQLTATVARNKLKTKQRGRDRVARPYMQRALSGDPFYLSNAYISRFRKRPSLTSVQTIFDEDGRALGYLGADFDLRKLPHTAKLNLDKKGWMQLKGDPAIRGGLFAQQRIVSAMDEKLDDVMSLMEELIVAHGVFHAKLHFSSSRATVWLVDTPYDYQILNIDELTDASLCLAFPKRDYFEQARVPRKKIGKIFKQFKKLRFADETIYLRSASLNIVNEKVGLNFSCDGSHYVSYDEFLEKDNSFWFGVK